MVLDNFSNLVEAIEFAITIKTRTTDEIGLLHALIKTFLEGFERLYIGDDPAKVIRARLCIFQLIHVPQHIIWNGSIRLGSQATVERAIGEMGHKVRSRKAPFANLANLIYERELVKLLLLYHPSLQCEPKSSNKTGMFGKAKILKREKADGQDFYQHLYAICFWLNKEFDPDLDLCRWGKIYLPNKQVLSSKLSETRGGIFKRSSRYFEVQRDETSQPVFGEALAFYKVVATNDLLVVFHPLHNPQKILKRWRGKWSDDIHVLEVTKISG